eukprot:Opistho-2@66629
MESRSRTSSNTEPRVRTYSASLESRPRTSSASETHVPITVSSVSGEAVPLTSLWKDRVAVVCFLRHLGCRFCRQQVTAMMTIKDRLDKAGVPLVCVSLGQPEDATKFVAETKFRGELFVDTDAQAPKSYRAMRLANGMKVFEHESVKGLAQAALDEGFQDGTYTGDITQIGGVFVLGPGNSCDFAYRSQYAGDHPNPEDVLAAATGAVSEDTTYVFPSTEAWVKRIRADVRVEKRESEVDAQEIVRAMGGPQPFTVVEEVPRPALVIPAPVDNFLTPTANRTALSVVVGGIVYQVARRSPALASLLGIGAGREGLVVAVSLAALAFIVLTLAERWLAVPLAARVVAVRGEESPQDESCRRRASSSATAPAPAPAPTSEAILRTPRDVDELVLSGLGIKCDCGNVEIPVEGFRTIDPEEDSTPALARSDGPTAADITNVSTAPITPEDLEVLQVNNCYVREFLAKPHPLLGRKGSTCPFVPVALKQNSIYMTVYRTGPDATADDICALARGFVSRFLQLEPTDGKRRMNKAVMLIFPDVRLRDAVEIIDKTQAKLKPDFVAQGLMIGEFHLNNNTPGLHNPEFYPLRTPYPSLAIRHMAPSDLVFLSPEQYSAATRVRFLESYIEQFGVGDEASKNDRQLVAAREALEKAKTELGLP